MAHPGCGLARERKWGLSVSPVLANVQSTIRLSPKNVMFELLFKVDVYENKNSLVLTLTSSP